MVMTVAQKVDYKVPQRIVPLHQAVDWKVEQKVENVFDVDVKNYQWKSSFLAAQAVD